MDSLSFDSMAGIYDETRTVDEGCLRAALDFVAKRFPPDTFGQVVYPGIGTGRIAVPLAARGYAVTGVDISERMLSILRARLSRFGRPLQIRVLQADAAKLPLRSEAFDLAIAVHLFYFVRDWRRAADEALRVVRKSGSVILMHTGPGAEVAFINRRYKELCAAEGHVIRSVGVQSSREVVSYFEECGCAVEEIRGRWQWTTRVQAGTALSYVGARAYSFTALTPSRVHQAVMATLAPEVQAHFRGLETVVEVPSEIYLVLVAP
jgi:ubiquinone/menaquinone biosynthesis C-methylase UbiE